MNKYLTIFIYFLIITFPCLSQHKVSGVVYDSVTSRPIESVKINIYGNDSAFYSNPQGSFNLGYFPAGRHKIILHKTGYAGKELVINIDTNSANSFFINIPLSSFETVTDTIDVQGKYYKKNEGTNTSHINVLNDEIRKTPGTAEDVIRYFENAPGVSVENDIENALVVRGGSVLENLTVIDGIEVQNPNHYGPPGTTNGLLSFINLHLVKDVDFFTGGFPVKYGDKLSSVMNIIFREGNRHKHVQNINLSATGFGGFFEGPINAKTSYMFSLRRSYLELFKKQLNAGIIPYYWDSNLKLNYEISANEKIAVTGIFAIDDALPLNSNPDFVNDTVHAKLLISGITYSKSKVNSDYSMTAAYNWSKVNANYSNFLMDENERELSLKQNYSFKPFDGLTVNLFDGLRYFFPDYKLVKGGFVNYYNMYDPPTIFDKKITAFKLSCGFGFTNTMLHGRLAITAGLRLDGFSMIRNKYCVSPRIGVTYKISDLTMINANAGIYYQAPEILWVISNEANKDLEFIRLNEIVFGVEHYISNDIIISFEPFLKQYYNYPVSVYNPIFNYINGGAEAYGSYFNRALSYGKGYFYGADVLFQKKNSFSGVYWTLTYTYTKSAFVALEGGVQPAMFDPGNKITAVAGYKFRSGLSLSTRFSYEAGKYYTPIDSVLSKEARSTVYDISKLEQEKLPYYQRWDIRIDYQAKFGNILCNFYLDVINILNRENFYNYYWSPGFSTVKANLQLPRLPVVGVNVKF